MSDESFCSCQTFESNGTMATWKPSNSCTGVMEQMKRKALVQVQFQRRTLTCQSAKSSLNKNEPRLRGRAFKYTSHSLTVLQGRSCIERERENGCWKRHLIAAPERVQILARTDAHRGFLVCPFSPELVTNFSIAAFLPSVSLISVKRWWFAPDNERSVHLGMWRVSFRQETLFLSGCSWGTSFMEVTIKNGCHTKVRHALLGMIAMAPKWQPFFGKAFHLE